MRVFRAPSLDFVRRRYPGFGGPVFVHELQAHIVRTVVSPRLERHVPRGGVALDTVSSLRRWFERSGFETLEVVHVADPSYRLFSRSLFQVTNELGRVAARLPLERFRMHIVDVFRLEGALL